jgi:hypothetical protein
MIQLLPATNTISTEYRLNSLGYRCCEFTGESFDSTWLFGCSYAFGWAVAEEHTVGYQLSLLLEEPVLNLGQGGTSIRYQVDQFALLLSQGLRPRRVAVIWPDPHRCTWIGSQGRLQPRLSQQLRLAHAEDEQYVNTRAHLDIQQFRLLCQFLAVPSAELTWSTHTQAVTSGPKGFEDPVSWSYPELDLGWDQQHPGPTSHRVAAEEIVLQFQGVNVP